MSPEQWNKVAELFQAAREKTGEERVALLDSALSDDPSLRAVIEQMLRDDQAACSFLNESPLQAFAAAADSGKNTASDARVIAGLKFGRYEVVAPIGRGGMGEVWMGHDPELDRPVALKFLVQEAAFGGAAERLTREARAASALNHPNIVTVHEVIRHEETSIIVMELVEGTALRAMCGAPQPLDRVISHSLQIARALAAAHAHGIVHRDIKPENILVRQDGYVKVLDFGLARRVESEEITSTPNLSGGTLRYMSPEQARGESTSPASDIFSFGLVLYELATGQHAFPSDSPFGAVCAMLTNEPVAPSSVNPLVPRRLDSLILGMLAKDSGVRPSAEDVAQTLNGLQVLNASSSPSAPDAATTITAGSRGKRVTASLLVLLACSLLIWFWKRHGASEKQPAFYQVTTLVPENRATAAAISPDGRWTAYANVDGIFLRTMPNGETRALRGPGDFAVDRLAWFADGTKLVASGFSTVTYVPSVWTISAMGAPPHLVRTMASQGNPSPDGTRIGFTSQDRSAIWVMGANGEAPRKVLNGAAGDTFPLVFWSANGRWLAFERRHYSAKRDRPNRSLERYYEQSYESLALDTGKVVTRVPDLWIGSAAVLPDGRMLFLRWDSPGSDASQQLWQVKTDVTTGAFLGAPRRITGPAGENDIQISNMSATTDGKLVMVLRESVQKAVFVGDFAPSPPRITGVHRLTLDERTNYPHAWTRDSRAVIFESNRNGSFDLFKQYIDRRMPETIVATPLTEMLPQLGPDGRFVLYEARAHQIEPGADRLMRVPVEGGTPQEVPIGGPPDEFRCALDFGSRCVLRTTVAREYHVYYDLDPVTGKGRELARTKWIPGILGDWDVSPDGKYVALPNHDSHDARIRMVSLEHGPNDSREREVVLSGLSNIRGLVWAADGRGWFVSMDTTIGNRLLYVYLDGRFHSLGDIQGWAVPSPDGHRVAFLDRIVATNAWLIDRR